jgi:hypothetical protein
MKEYYIPVIQIQTCSKHLNHSFKADIMHIKALNATATEKNKPFHPIKKISPFLPGLVPEWAIIVQPFSTSGS